MALRKAKGNMFGFITHLWNPVKGKCVYNCNYCFVKRFYKKYNLNVPDKPYLDKKEFVNLGKHKFIFICDNLDLFHPYIPGLFILEIINHINKYTENRYLFLTKNPERYLNYISLLRMKNIFLGVTIESNIIKTENTPEQLERFIAIKNIKAYYNIKTLICIEPIMNFNLSTFMIKLKFANPDYIVIGADSGNNKLNEPCKNKLNEFISCLNKDKINSKIILKSNLQRLLK